MSSVKENISKIKFLAVEEHCISGSPAAISLWSAAPTIMDVTVPKCLRPQPVTSVLTLSLSWSLLLVQSPLAADYGTWWHCVCRVWTSVTRLWGCCSATCLSWRGWTWLTAKTSQTRPLLCWQQPGHTRATTSLSSHWQVGVWAHALNDWSCGLLSNDWSHYVVGSLIPRCLTLPSRFLM